MGIRTGAVLCFACLLAAAQDDISVVVSRDVFDKQFRGQAGSKGPDEFVPRCLGPFFANQSKSPIRGKLTGVRSRPTPAVSDVSRTEL